MSHRDYLFEQEAQGDGTVELFCDYESGTWRLFLGPSFSCVDLSLSQLKELAASLNGVISEIEADDDKNAEIRYAQYQEVGVL